MKKKPAKKTTKKINKDSVSGKFVSNDYVKKHKDTTQIETVPINKTPDKKPLRKNTDRIC